jgi:hypothetical protein
VVEAPVELAATRGRDAAIDISPEPLAPRTQFRCMYVYLVSGAIETVPAVTCLEVSDRSVLLRSGEGPVVEYPRTAVFFMSRALISPPVMF